MRKNICFREKSAVARLGYQNLRSDIDGLKGLNFAIREFIPHENYNRLTQQNDIALAKLATEVKFTKQVRPACLWQTLEIDSNTTIATGWGQTESNIGISDELIKVELDIYDTILCERIYEDEDYLVNENNICSGVLEGGRDTCQGDSGGPIQILTPGHKCLHSIIGITSFGLARCGIRNSAAVYTRVSAYLDWIEARVWNEVEFS